MNLKKDLPKLVIAFIFLILGIFLFYYFVNLFFYRSLPGDNPLVILTVFQANKSRYLALLKILILKLLGAGICVLITYLSEGYIKEKNRFIGVLGAFILASMVPMDGYYHIFSTIFGDYITFLFSYVLKYTGIYMGVFYLLKAYRSKWKLFLFLVSGLLLLNIFSVSYSGVEQCDPRLAIADLTSIRHEFDNVKGLYYELNDITGQMFVMLGNLLLCVPALFLMMKGIMLCQKENLEMEITVDKSRMNLICLIGSLVGFVLLLYFCQKISLTSFLILIFLSMIISFVFYHLADIKNQKLFCCVFCLSGLASVLFANPIGEFVLVQQLRSHYWMRNILPMIFEFLNLKILLLTMILMKISKGKGKIFYGYVMGLIFVALWKNQSLYVNYNIQLLPWGDHFGMGDPDFITYIFIPVFLAIFIICFLQLCVSQAAIRQRTIQYNKK